MREREVHPVRFNKLFALGRCLVGFKVIGGFGPFKKINKNMSWLTGPKREKGRRKENCKNGT